MTLFFQNPSIGSVLLTFPQILRAKRVVFYRPYWLAQGEGNSRSRQRAEKLIRWINRRAEVTGHDPEESFPLAHENNLASDRYMEDFFSSVSRSASYAILLDLIQDAHMDRFYKIHLLPWVLYQTQFYRTARQWTDHEEEAVIVPGSHDRYSFHRYFFTQRELRLAIPAAVRAGLWTQERLSDGLHRLLGISLLLLLVPPIHFLLNAGWRSGIRKRALPIRTDVVTPLIWGFNDDGTTQGLKTGVDNASLLGGELTSSRVAFYFSDWTFTPEERRLQEERMTRRGIRYFDPKRFPLTLRFLRESLDLYGRLWSGILRRPRLWAEDPRIARASSALLYHFLQGRLFITWVEYKVLIEYQDYSSTHVIRTILSEKMGRLTVGHHHSAPDGPAGFPGIRYTHIHRHGVWGEAFLRSYGEHWDHMQNILVGYWRTDLVKAAQKESCLQGLKDRFQQRYGGYRPLVVLLFPTLEEYNVLPRLREEIEGLCLLRSLPGEFTVVCRFRSAELAKRYRALGLEEVLRQDSRIVIDLSDFTTYEWIALSDAVIVSSISTGMIEGAAAGKPTFTFDHNRLAERVFSPYGKELVLKNRQDVVRVFEKILSSGFQEFDCQWDRLARDFSHHSDGECLQRYRQMILRAVEEGKR